MYGELTFLLFFSDYLIVNRTEDSPNSYFGMCYPVEHNIDLISITSTSYKC